MIQFGHEITGNFDLAAQREWLVTNGLGGWASGTVSGANTRRYHGLFVPALQPPLGRTVLVSKVNDRARLGGQTFALSSNEYEDGTIDPHGYRHLESFQLDGLVPTWYYALADALLEKRIWMPYRQNLTLLTYTLKRGARPLTLDLTLMVTARDAHTETHAVTLTPSVEPVSGGVRLSIGDTHFRASSNLGTFTPLGHWHYKIKHRVETERGLPDLEDQYAAGTFTAELKPGQTLVLAFSLDDHPPLDWHATQSLAAERARASDLVAQAGMQTEYDWVQQLVLAADQFIVKRDSGQTVIAGYHWFGDWGRDTMIALPGLTLTTGRHETAAAILRTFARYVSEGMLPNRFPDVGEKPRVAYNTVDATLWYFHAIEQYTEASGDDTLARELFPVLEDLIGWHILGTRYHIHLDAGDGLIYAGQPGVQLTWMDAKVGDWVVTPRIGKPVEINALWINALWVMDALCRKLGVLPQHPYGAMAAKAAKGFEKFWHAAGGYLYDVIEGPEGADAALRPNQLFAISLPHGPLSGPEHLTRARSIVDQCAAHLVTSYGLRSLAPTHRDYNGVFTGDQWHRDATYHQGTVWGWLIGPFVEAHFKVYGDVYAARSFLTPFEQHLSDFGLGSIAEVFEGNPPFVARGCIAQAWSVAEVLRLWAKLKG